MIKYSRNLVNRWLYFIIFYFIFFQATDTSYAAAMLYRVQMIKARKHKQAQEEYQHPGENAQNPQAPTQKTYQQMVDERNQAIAQAILNAHNPAVSSGNLNDEENSAPQQTTGPVVVQQQQAAPAAPPEVKEVVDLSAVWNKLDKKSTVWTLLIDDQAKLLTVSEYIGRFQKQGVKINEPPLHYAQMIDQIAAGNPQVLDKPFGELLQILAIVDYDYDNGMDKDALARKVLGEGGYETNKRRFSQQ